MTLRAKFILSIALGIILSSLLASSYGYYSIRSNLVDTEGQRLENVAYEAFYRLDSTLQARKRELLLLSAMDVIRSSFEYDVFEQAEETLHTFQQQFKMYAALHLINKSSAVVASSLEKHPDNLQVDYQPLAISSFWRSEPYMQKDNSKHLIDFVVPVYVGNDQAGVLVGQYDMDHLFQTIDEMKVSGVSQTPESHIMIANTQGEVIYAPAFERKAGVRLMDENLKNENMESAKLALGGGAGHLVEANEHGIDAITGYYGSKLNENFFFVLTFHELDDALKSTREFIYGLGMIAALLIVIGSIIAVFVGNMTANPILKVINGLKKAASHLDQVSNTLLKSSNVQSEGASRQAASFEEVSSTVTETAATVNQNAENSSQASQMVKETNGIVVKANESMEKLRHTIQKISDFSDSTANIVQTIDSIAFQTNLLALNAAVEAARAGEAGAGFAVVADEVRNLAQRSAKSAHDTAELIESVLKEIGNSTKLAEEVNSVFEDVAKSSEKLEQIINNIALASNEQSRALEQIAQSVIEVEGIAQENAATSEKSAEDAGLLRELTTNFSEYVERLELVVGSASHKENGTLPAKGHETQGGAKVRKKSQKLLGMDDVAD